MQAHCPLLCGSLISHHESYGHHRQMSSEILSLQMYFVQFCISLNKDDLRLIESLCVNIISNFCQTS